MPIIVRRYKFSQAAYIERMRKTVNQTGFRTDKPWGCVSLSVEWLSNVFLTPEEDEWLREFHCIAVANTGEKTVEDIFWGKGAKASARKRMAALEKSSLSGNGTLFNKVFNQQANLFLHSYQDVLEKHSKRIAILLLSHRLKQVGMPFVYDEQGSDLLFNKMLNRPDSDGLLVAVMRKDGTAHYVALYSPVGRSKGYSYFCNQMLAFDADSGEYSFEKQCFADWFWSNIAMRGNVERIIGIYVALRDSD